MYLSHSRTQELFHKSSRIRKHETLTFRYCKIFQYTYHKTRFSTETKLALFPFFSLFLNTVAISTPLDQSCHLFSSYYLFQHFLCFLLVTVRSYLLCQTRSHMCITFSYSIPKQLAFR